MFKNKSKFEIAIAKSDFNEISDAASYKTMPVSSIKELDESIPGIGTQRAIVRWSFEEGVEIGDFKSFNVSGGGFVVAKITSVNEKGLMSVEKASVTALTEIRKEKKAALIIERISATTLDAIASEEDQTVKTALAVNMKNPTLSGAGREPKVVGTAFGLIEGETSKLVVGLNGIYAVQLTKSTPANELPNYQAAANRVGQAKSNAVNSILYTALKDAAEIEDYRASFY